MKKLLVALALLCAPFLALADDEYTPDEHAWLRAVAPFYNEAKSFGIDSYVGVVTDAKPGQSPVSMMYKSDTHQCVFVVAARDNFMSRTIDDLLPHAPASVVRAATIAHEYGHCVIRTMKLNHSLGYELLPNTETPQDERLADTFALAWYARNQPEHYETVQRFFHTLRSKFSDDMHPSLDIIDSLKDLPERMANKPGTPMQWAMYLDLGAPMPTDNVSLSASAASVVAPVATPAATTVAAN